MPPELMISQSSAVRRLAVDAPRSAAGVRRRTYRYHGGQAMRVADAMTWPAVVVHVETTAGNATRIAEQHAIHHLPVVDSGTLAGVLCVCDLFEAPPSERVRRLMRTRVATITIGATLDMARLAMTARGVGCLPVTATGFVCGIVTRGDLIRTGAMDSELRPTCAACGGHHHVLSDRGSVPFCRACLERGHPTDEYDPYEELGLGD